MTEEQRREERGARERAAHAETLTDAFLHGLRKCLRELTAPPACDIEARQHFLFSENRSVVTKHCRPRHTGSYEVTSMRNKDTVVRFEAHKLFRLLCPFSLNTSI